MLASWCVQEGFTARRSTFCGGTHGRAAGGGAFLTRAGRVVGRRLRPRRPGRPRKGKKQYYVPNFLQFSPHNITLGPAMCRQGEAAAATAAAVRPAWPAGSFDASATAAWREKECQNRTEKGQNAS